jgi:hypothetical protein
MQFTDRHRILLSLFVCLSILGFGAPHQAVANLFDLATTQSPRSEPDPFRPDQWTIDFTTSYTHPTSLDQHRFVTGSLGLSYVPIDRVMVSLDLTGDYIQQTGTGAGGGFNLRGRYELAKLQSISLFVDGSAGIIETDQPIPTRGTHFNFIETVGCGAFVPVLPRLFLEAGIRFQHISNAGISVNPGHSGMQGYLGFAIPL